MKKNNRFLRNERGQALIMIVFAIVGLIALTALTVDGGNAYSNRRHAQNAADTAAFAAARAKVRNENWKQAALLIAESNGYADTDSTSASSSTKINVEVYQCNESGVDCKITLKAGDTLQNYLQVKITSTIDTYFGGVIGVWQVANRVNSVVRVKEGTNQPIGSGSAVFSLNPSGCSAVTYGGNATVELVGSGLYVNSTCPTGAFSNTSNSPGFIAPCIQAGGGITYNPSSIKVPASCILQNQPPLPPPTMPNPTCATNAVQTGNTISPGNWTGQFPTSSSGITYLQSGVYCVSNGDFRLNSGAEIHGHGVTIFIKNGVVTWNGQATIDLQAPSSGDFKGLLLYLPPTNANTVTINGGGSSHIVGTILAPASTCVFEGGGGLSGLEAQLVCYNVKFTGNSNTKLIYNSNDQYQPYTAPVIELTK